jgi:hypothetical protein
MFKKFTILILLFVAFANQGNSQSLNNLEEINRVWKKFYQSFDSLDYKLMAEIHSKKLIRISGGKSITDYKTYINRYKTSFEKAKEQNISNKISLRFFERINNDSIASERGIYKLVRVENKKDQQTYYGQFHVVFVKEKAEWKILMDYDSNEADTIGEKDYLKAFGINDLDRFTQN